MQLNNNFNIIIEILLIEIIYDFKIKKIFSLLYNYLVKSIVDKFNNYCLKYCTKIIKIIVFANTKTKIYYNAYYVFIIIKFNKKTYFKLNYKY